ncbi:MAG: right-handed parallel beta-helix repeat-containing protein [Oscillospiraceae bacterium]|nr:right-handed parallel beta-helix repeat-containing protein [Oscillospiraceae bacterium]
MKKIKQAVFTSFCAVSLALTLSANVFPVHCAAERTDTLADETQTYYADWKSTYLRKNPYTAEEQYYVFYGEQTYAEAKKTVPVTVSEAHGYGMLIAALMSEYDSDAHEIFDGMYRYYLAHPSGIAPHLMAWQQSDNGRALIDSGGADSATDGDLDIAYALLLADSVWGSNGGIDYYSAAKLMIDDIMQYEVSQTDWILRLGDWAYDVDESDKYYTATRASDFIMQYFPVFADVTGDARWMQLYDSTYTIINQFVDTYRTGLLPDFIIRDQSGKWIPAPAEFLEDENDGNYYYNSCRVPWRISTDALVGKNADAKKYAETVNSFFVKKTGGDPEQIMAGYTPDGSAVSDWDDLCFTAPLMLSAAAAGDTKWHDAVRKEVLEIGTDSYFGNTIAMLCLITDDGGWKTPNTAKPTGDLNADGKTDADDVNLLQTWLLAVPETKLADWKAGDMDGNGKLNAVDLSLLKQMLLKKPVNAVTVSDIESIFNAVRNAKPGDVIQIAPGTYDYSVYQGAQKIDTKAAGTVGAPITLTAADPANPPVLTGNSTENGYVLHIQGDYWILDNLICTTSQKGIVLDHSSHSVIQNCEVKNTGAEAIALRDGSSDCTVKSCSIHDTGKVSPGYGEGVYIGSAYSTTGFDYKCDNNKVLNCTFKNVAAEHVDVKEFTTGTEIAGCTFYGDGMTGANYAGSFIDIAGNNCYVHDNTGYRNKNPKIVAAFEIHDQADGWSYHHRFENNTLYMDRAYGEEDTSRRMYVVDGWFSDIRVHHNLVDYGSGLTEAAAEYYNADSIQFAE